MLKAGDLGNLGGQDRDIIKSLRDKFEKKPDVSQVNIKEIVKQYEEVAEKAREKRNYFERLKAIKAKEIEDKFKEEYERGVKKGDTGLINVAQKRMELARTKLALGGYPEVLKAQQEMQYLKAQEAELKETILAFEEKYRDLIEEIKREKLKQEIIEAGLHLKKPDKNPK